MTVRQLSLELDLDAGRFTANMTSAAGETLRFQRSVDTANTSVRNMERSAGSTLGTLRDLTIVFSGLRGAISTVNDMTVGWITSMVQSSATMQRTIKMLEGMSDAADALGKKQDAAGQLGKLLDLAQKTPFSLHALTDATVKLKSAGLDPLNGTLKGITEAVARFGGSDQQLDRAALAIQQMAGKGVISMEELRRQLGEAVPTAMNMMAAGMGMSYAQLSKAVQSGTVESKTAIEKMIAMFNLAYGGSAQAMMETFGGKLTVLSTKWQQFSMAVTGLEASGGYSDNSLLKTLTTQLQGFLDAMDSPEFKQFGIELGRGLNDAAVGAENLVKHLDAFSLLMPGMRVVKDLIVGIALALGTDLAVKAAGAARAAVNEMGVAFRGLGTATRVIVQDFSILGDLWRTSGKSLSEFNSVVALSGASLRAFGAATLNLLPVIGQIAFVLYTVADAFGIFRDKAKEAEQAIADFKRTGFTTGDNVKLVGGQLEKAQQELENAKNSLASMNAIKKQRSDAGFGVMPFSDADLAQAKARLDKAKSLVDGLTQTMSTMQKTLLKDHVQGEANSTANLILGDGDFAKVDRSLVTLEQAFEKKRALLTQSGADQATMLQATREYAAQAKDLNDRYISDLEGQIKQQETTLKKMYGSAPAEAIAGKIALIDNLNKKLTEKVKASNDNIAALNKDDVLLGGKGGKATAADNMIAQLSERAAQLKAQLQGSYGEAAKLAEALTTDKKLMASMSPDQQKQAMGLAQSIDALKKQLEGKTAFDKLIGDQTKYAEATADLKDQFDALSKSTDTSVQINAQFDAGIDRLVGKAKDFGKDMTDVGEAIKRSHAEMAAFQDAVKLMGKLNGDITGFQSQSDSIFSQILGGKDKLNKEYENYKRQVDVWVQQIIQDAKGDQKMIAEALAKGDAAVTAFAQSQAGEAAADMLAKAKQINTDLVQDVTEKSRTATQNAIDDMFRRVEWDKLTADQRKATEDAYWAYVKARQAQGAEEAKGPLERMADAAAKVGENMQQAATGWIDDFIGGLVEGNLSMAEFTKKILEDIAKIILRALIMRAIMAGLGMLGLNSGAAMGGVNVPTPGAGGIDPSGVPNIGSFVAHSGGVIGKDKGMGRLMVDPSVFTNARRYHVGGTAGLRPGEVPAILKKGEGVFTEEQMKSLGGNRVPNVQVNVINNSGQQLSAQQGQTRFDAKGAIIDVIVDAMSKPGKMRDAVKGAAFK